jgi:hypothetical protein
MIDESANRARPTFQVSICSRNSAMLSCGHCIGNAVYGIVRLTAILLTTCFTVPIFPVAGSNNDKIDQGGRTTWPISRQIGQVNLRSNALMTIYQKLCLIPWTTGWGENGVKFRCSVSESYWFSWSTGRESNPR